jgi:fatty-acyl-CoA synthase
MAALGQILRRHAARVPDREAVVLGSRRLTYAELNAEVNRAATVLTESGLAKGDRIALMSPNSIGFVTTFYAAMKLGLIVVPVNPRLATPEVTHILDDSGASGFVLHPDVAERALPACAAAAAPPRTVLATDPGCTVDDLATRSVSASAAEPDVDVDEADDAEILYTSGTTGRPKGVLLDQHRVIWSGLNVNLTVGIADGARLLDVAPFYHSAGLNLFLNGGVQVAATHVILRDFEPGTVLDAMETERISTFFGVPTMYRILLDHPDVDRRDLSAWRKAMFGAAPMPPATVTRLARAVPHVELYNLCGPTEAGPGGLSLGPEHVHSRPGENGWAILNTEARVVDPDGQDVAGGATGEVVLRSDSVMKEYWGNPTATADAIRDGWLHTGDLARIDGAGSITLVDRMQDMIITGGMNVYSVEVENALAEYPGIADCAVVGVPHPTFGESIVAVLTPDDGVTPTLADIRAHVASLIADYKAPHRVVLGPVPRNPSGKIVKTRLREWLGDQTLHHDAGTGH